jgi:hypothetical protein
MKVSGQVHAPAALHPRERAVGTHWIGGCILNTLQTMVISNITAMKPLFYSIRGVLTMLIQLLGAEWDENTISQVTISIVGGLSCEAGS